MRVCVNTGKTFGVLRTIVNISAIWGPAEACSVPGCAGGVAANPTIVGDDTTAHIFIFFSWYSVSSQHSTHNGTGPRYYPGWDDPRAFVPMLMKSTDHGDALGPRTAVRER